MQLFKEQHNNDKTITLPYVEAIFHRYKISFIESENCMIQNFYNLNEKVTFNISMNMLLCILYMTKGVFSYWFKMSFVFCWPLWT